MPNLNRVQLMGNLGKDPESKYVNSGKMVANFSLAINNTYTDGNGERKTQTEWVNLEAWGKLAELAIQYLSKGSKLYVEGRLKTDSSEDKDGSKKYYTKVVISSMQFLDNVNAGKNKETPAETPLEDDIPY